MKQKKYVPYVNKVQQSFFFLCALHVQPAQHIASSHRQEQFLCPVVNFAAMKANSSAVSSVVYDLWRKLLLLEAYVSHCHENLKKPLIGGTLLDEIPRWGYDMNLCSISLFPVVCVYCVVVETNLSTFLLVVSYLHYYCRLCF